jgi:hypothetical protein
MKALTLTQPWATAVALGSKRVETRSWPTSYRGEIAIHAAKGGCSKYDLIDVTSSWTWCGALMSLGLRMGNGFDLEAALPFGKIVAVANLVDCRRTDDFTQSEIDTRRFPTGESVEIYSWTERMMGNFSLGRFGFVLENVRSIPSPIAVRGMLGLWNVPADVAHSVSEQLDRDAR